MSTCLPDSVRRTTLDTGATVDVVSSRAVELRDPEGRLLVRYGSDGSLTLAAPAGDLVLEAPNGAVRIAARGALEIDAASASIRVTEELELRATRFVTRARDVLRDTTGLVQERAGRMRLLVADLLRVESDSTTMLSERETTIDGSRIHIG